MLNKNKFFFNSADDVSIPYYEYSPKKDIKSVIILIYEIFGVTKHIHNFAQMLAGKGYLVQIPDIFSRIEKDVNLQYDKLGFERGLYLKKKLGWDFPIMDIVSLAALVKQKFKVSSLGFCYGGSIAWRASQKSFLFDKAVCYYGSSIPDFLDKKINNPVLAHFGKLDKGIPEEKIKSIKDFSKKQNFELQIFEYENSDHGFNCDDRKSYNKPSSVLALKRTLNFIEREDD